MSIHRLVNTPDAYLEDSAHTIERIKALEPEDPHRYDQARARAIAILGSKYVFHWTRRFIPTPGCTWLD